MANKTVKFQTKLIHDNKVYLKLSDVTKALGYSKQQDFINEYPSFIEKISGIHCIRETNYNNLLSKNETALKQQGQIEVSKIETLRSNIDSVMSFQPLKVALARDFLQMMASRNRCTVEEYILLHELPKEKQKALQELIQNNETSKKYYQNMIDYLNDKKRFDIDKIKNCGLDIQFLTSVQCDGRINLEAYVVGKGVFCSVSDLGDYSSWIDLYVNDDGDVILPWSDYDSSNPEERMINLSQIDIDRDFSKYNVVENMLWCIENLKVDVLEDYEYEIFGYHDEPINFSMPIELLVKIMKPESVSTIYIDKIIDVETGRYLTKFDEKKVFEGDFK
ncbi:MAG: hypothetical protein IJE43_22135 [Alphaproteobacteria bacterium]|nr:hypothetical protein [Alphaproteobacteria bacterium]MBQ3512516.1 hypothetical protein [Lachnospiraceae bacterium]MBQ6817557.1 hypothetical protein [Bacilli bacterium]